MPSNAEQRLDVKCARQRDNNVHAYEVSNALRYVTSINECDVFCVYVHIHTQPAGKIFHP